MFKPPRTGVAALPGCSGRPDGRSTAPAPLRLSRWSAIPAEPVPRRRHHLPRGIPGARTRPQHGLAARSAQPPRERRHQWRWRTCWIRRNTARIRMRSATARPPRRRFLHVMALRRPGQTGYLVFSNPRITSCGRIRLRRRQSGGQCACAGQTMPVSRRSVALVTPLRHLVARRLRRRRQVRHPVAQHSTGAERDLEVRQFGHAAGGDRGRQPGVEVVGCRRLRRRRQVRHPVAQQQHRREHDLEIRQLGDAAGGTRVTSRPGRGRRRRLRRRRPSPTSCGATPAPAPT